ncbi:MAG: zinc-binding dehydrogenase [Sulfolobales archaeon]
MRAYLLRSFGGPEVLRIEEIEGQKPGWGEALVRIVSTSVNRADILIRSGHPEYRVRLPHILGGDVYGFIEDLGEGVDGFERGDSVVANFIYGCGRCYYCSLGLENMCRSRYIIGHNRWGSYSEYIVLPARALIKVNGFQKPEELGAVPLALVTAWRSLVTLSRIKPGQRVFIWAASGGVGTYAIQIAKLFGAEVIAAVGDNEKGRKLLSIGADHLVYYREEDSVSRVVEITGGEGVDIVLNSVGGDTVQKSIDMLRPGGTLVIIGVIAGSEARVMLRRAYLKGIVITGTAGGNRWELREALEMVRRSRIKPIIYKEYGFEEIPEAHRELEEGRVIGKLLIHVSRR